MMLPSRTVDGINVTQGIATSEEGATADVITYLDDEGDETDDPTEALVAIVKWRDCEFWSAIDLSMFERVMGH